jgi:hypothetical protein
MRRVLSVLALSTFWVGATALTGFAVTSDPQPSAGAPATSASPPSSATEQHEGATHGGGKKQEAQERKAIKHTQKAITQGKAGNAQGLRKHAEMALTIAEAADKRHAEAHVEEGIKHLKLAVEEAQKGNAAEGTKHAEEALTRLKEK